MIQSFVYKNATLGVWPQTLYHGQITTQASGPGSQWRIQDLTLALRYIDAF